jgi:hypothetical protein
LTCTRRSDSSPVDSHILHSPHALRACSEDFSHLSSVTLNTSLQAILWCLLIPTYSPFYLYLYLIIPVVTLYNYIIQSVFIRVASTWSIGHPWNIYFTSVS